ncbi:hypothetical protein BHE74_00001275 [Ensete ventricosum]|nr:hypothetical protein BHE74_00001275 [Ensete ventricosum]RZR80293.1 hypothetical protein BHM03_00006294 [Ensete ventricosum]
MCNEYDTSLDLEGCGGDCIGKESQSSKCICGAEQGTSCSARQSSPKGMVVELGEVSKPYEGSRHRRWNMERRHGAFLGQRATRELDCFSAHIRLREPGKSEDKAEWSKGRGSDDESSGAQLPKSKASARKEMDSEEHHSAAEVDLLIAKEGMKMHAR